MASTLKVDGPTRRTLSFSIERERMRSEVEQRLTEVARQASFKGFRPGKAPLSLVRRAHGEKAAEEVRRKLMSDSFRAALEEHKLHPVGEPELNLQQYSDEGEGPFTFELSFEIAPEFELRPLAGIPVEIELLDVDDALVEREVQRFRQRGARVEDAPEGHPADTDSVLSCAVTYVVNGEPLDAREDRVVFVKHDLVDGVSVPGSGAAFAGKRTGETVELELDLPESFEPEEHRGRRAIARVTLSGHRRVIVPEIGEELLAQAGVPDVAGLRDRIRSELEQQREQARAQAVDRAVEDWLVANHPLELPERLTAKSIDKRVHDHAHQLMEKQGLDSEAGHHAAEDQREHIATATRRALAASFVLGRIAREQQLQAGAEETAEQIRLIARAQQGDPDAALRDAVQQGWFQDVAANLTEQKVREWLRAQAKVTVKAPAPPPTEG